VTSLKPLIGFWHKGLLNELRLYGIQGNMYHWIENYIGDRAQKVVFYI
jgi:hypothetical protein